MRWVVLVLAVLLAGCIQGAPVASPQDGVDAARPADGGTHSPEQPTADGATTPLRHPFNGTVSYSRHAHVRNCPSQTIVGNEPEESLVLPSTDAQVLNLTLAWIASDPINERLRFRIDAPTVQGRDTVATFDATSPFVFELRDRVGGQALILFLEGPGCPASPSAAVAYEQAVDVRGWWAAGTG